MKYAKITFWLALGWYAGKVVFDTACRMTNTLICYYVPEKYRNRNHPDYPAKPTGKGRATDESKMKIGFYVD